jgi:hypothetical protein
VNIKFRKLVELDLKISGKPFSIEIKSQNLVVAADNENDYDKWRSSMSAAVLSLDMEILPSPSLTIRKMQLSPQAAQIGMVPDLPTQTAATDPHDVSSSSTQSTQATGDKSQPAIVLSKKYTID